MLSGLGCGYANNIPRRSGRLRTNISPCAWRCGVSASHTLNTCMTFLPSAMARSPLGKAARSSIGPVWARARPMHRSMARQHRLICRRIRMAVIVSEFDASCKIEAGDHHALFTREAGGRPEAEAAGRHAVHGRAGSERFDTLLLQRIDGALVFALRGKDALLAFEQQRDVGAQRRAVLAFADVSDSENHADAAPVPALRPADADAQALAAIFPRRPRTAFALHFRI